MRIRNWLSFKDFRLDRPLVLGLALLSAVGVLAIYSASKGTGHEGLHWKQCVWVALGWLAMLAVAKINYRTWMDYSLVLYGLLLGALLYLLVFGKAISGAKSWLVIGPIRCQPSEIMKIVVILVVARSFARYHKETIDGWFLLKLSAIVGVPALLIARQPDFGTALIFFGIFGVSLILAGLKRSGVVLLALMGILSGAAVWQYGLHDYQKDRIRTFLDPEADPLGSGYQVIQSKIAIGSGGLTGKGFAKGSQSRLDFVPEKHTDFIFTVFAEEMGFTGTVCLLGLLLGITLRCLHLASVASDRQGLVLAAGVSAVFVLHCLINIGMVIGLLPTAGIPLPMMSYGGSSVLSMMIGFGLALSVARERLAL